MNEKKIEIMFNIVKCTFSSNIKFLMPKKDTAPKIGIEIKKEILAASTLL